MCRYLSLSLSQSSDVQLGVGRGVLALCRCPATAAASALQPALCACCPWQEHWPPWPGRSVSSCCSMGCGTESCVVLSASFSQFEEL